MKKWIHKMLTAVLLILLVSGITRPETPPLYLYQVGVEDTIQSTILNEARTFWVHLPNSYERNTAALYPVIYLLDGSIHMNAVASILGYQASGYMPEMVIVGVGNYQHRTRDLTTSKVETRRGRPVSESGGAEQFTSFLKQELIPFIEAHYRITPYRTLIGHSYGGLFTINTLIHHKELFMNYVAIDPALDWDDQKLLKESEEVLKNDTYEGKSLFISIAEDFSRFRGDLNRDNVMADTTEFTLSERSTLAFIDLCRTSKTQMRLYTKYYADEIHGTVPLISIYEGLKTIFAWYQIKAPHEINNFDLPSDELYSILKKREKRLTDNFGYPSAPFDEGIIAMLADMSLGMGNAEKAKMLLELNIEYYPESANAHAALGTYYSNHNESAMAKSCFQKAYDLSGDAIYKARVGEIDATE